MLKTKMNGWVLLIFLGLTSFAQAAATASQAGTTFRDCPDCPEMVVIPAGSFDMGSSGYNEQPVHRVTINKAFSMGKTEVTQGQWRAIMGNNPSNFSNCGDNCPVEEVSWSDVQDYIQKLNAKTGKKYRLPSEAEWEYACRAGEQHEYCGSDNIDSVAWYGADSNPIGNSGKSTHPVATKQANAWGLYDMSGNVSEWVEDSYHDNYDGAPTDGSDWQHGDGRVIRGGSWGDDPDNIHTSTRAGNGAGNEQESRGSNIGFRVARSLP